MPAAYAHLTIVRRAIQADRLDAIPFLTPEHKRALANYSRYCELGAVSPDLPYLDFLHPAGKEWADLMHYNNTGEMLKLGANQVGLLPDSQRGKGLAWLFGYSTHVVADLTIHPVVELKVGAYKGNEKDHRICEMHQDVYIFSSLNLGTPGSAEFLRTGVGGCTKRGEWGVLDPSIEKLWKNILRVVHPEKYVQNQPDPASWFEGFVGIIDKFAEEGNRLIPIVRHLAEDSGLTYPAIESLDRIFLYDLETPAGRASYDEVFNRAVENVCGTWGLLGKTLQGDPGDLTAFVQPWNLDTGRDPSGRLTFWEGANA